MANYPGPNIATMTLRAVVDGAAVITNTFYYEMAGASVTDANANQVATSFQNIVGGLFAAMQGDRVVYQGSSLRVFATNSLIEGVADGTFKGAYSTDDGEDTQLLPLETALVIRKRVKKFGRKYVGRVFISGLASDMVSGDAVSTHGADLAKAIVDFLGADATFGGLTFHHRHWCRKDNTFEVISDCYYNTLLKSQRRRRTVRGAIYRT